MSGMRLRAAFAAVGTVLLLAACGSPREAMIAQGHPPAYADGYDDGCSSGKEAAGGLFAEARQDASRYGADERYTAGWDDGFENCRRVTAAAVLDARRRNPSRDK